MNSWQLVRKTVSRELRKVSYRTYMSHAEDNPRILITGGLGQLGRNLAGALRAKYGRDNVILSDIAKPSHEVRSKGPFVFMDVIDFKTMQQSVVDLDIDWIIHYGAILSAYGEQHVSSAVKVNVEGVTNILELARMYNLKVFIPSTIGAFGPETPRINTPDVTVQRPKTIYGVTKVYAELLGEYYCRKFGVDFRSLRYPGVVSPDLGTGAGTTDYVVDIFHKCLQSGSFTVNLKPQTALPMMYIDDCTKATVDLLSAPSDHLSIRTYNVTAMSFTPEQLEAEVRRHLPTADIEYKVDKNRQQIAETWPESLDDSLARRDWNWRPEYNLTHMVDTMFKHLIPVYSKTPEEIST